MLLNCVIGEDSWESLGCKEILPVHPKGNQSWILIGRTDVEAETPILWPPDGKKWLIWKHPDAGKDWRQEEKGTTEDEMVFRAMHTFCIVTVDKCHYYRCLVTKPCLTLWDPMDDSSPPGCSVHGILQARILEWVAISLFGESSRCRDRTCVSCVAGGFFTAEPPGKTICHYKPAECRIPTECRIPAECINPQNVEYQEWTPG